MKVFNLEKPKFEAHLESWSPRLKKENFLNSKYNLVYYGDLLWGINREDKINFENFEKNEITKISTKNPIFVGSSKEEIEYLILRQNEFKSKKIISFLNFKIFCLINYSDKIYDRQ